MSGSERVEVERVNGDFVKWCWRFWYYDHTLWLDYYAAMERPTRRHSFKVTEWYTRVDKRNASITLASDVVIPADVMTEAIDKFCKGIKVKRWEDGRTASQEGKGIK
jgi:hypothetical protein